MRIRAAVVALLVVIAACGGSSSSSAPRSSSVVHVTYKLTGHAAGPKASYTTATGVVERTIVNKDTAPSSVEESIEIDVPAGKQLTLTIEGQQYEDNVRCTIVGSDGLVLSDNAAQGLHNKATCEAAAA